MSDSFNECIDKDDIDELLAKAQEESLRYYNEVELPRLQLGEGNNNKDEDVLSSQVGGKAGAILYDGAEANGFHLSAGSTFIYPTNYPVRHYQAAMVKTALFKNTLVSLPTGLGKTFIAAVVMYNFYRWYPHGKVVFMAPTRPLVAQQTKACHHIMNIPQEDTTEMTGMQSAEQRAILWKEKRVFYLTPQVMVNDLKTKTCPASLIKCVVIDEAHRATKDYAYCQVLKLLTETDAVFRVLGLSATPGNDVNAVQQVIQNLHISALELRSEESLDVAPYTHSRSVETVVVELSGNIQRVREDLLQVFEKYAKKLKDFKALPHNISSISKFQVLKACEKFRANPPRGCPPSMIGSLIGDFTICMSLAHSLELLQIYGLRAFYNYLADENGEKSKAAANRLKNDEHLKEMLKRLQSCLFPKPNDNIPYTWGHPKLQKLVTSLTEHFQNAQQSKESTKAIIFCQYRVVVSEIVELLSKCKPLIKATEFIGQSGGKEKGMPQAKQLQIMKDFRNGLINCLVATCVAEEGLDIGEVDLIILMETHKSPIRLVQRLGRTGRKRKGRCIVLLTKGREEQKFHEAMATRKSYIQNIINAPAVKTSLCQESPRMIPSQFNPVQQLVHIQASNFLSPARPAGKKQADIRKCFTAIASSSTTEDDLGKVLQELNGAKLTFNNIPTSQELWHRRHEKKISVEELLSNNVSGFSEWNEWNFEEHEAYHISHTEQTRLYCHVLKIADREISLPDYGVLPGFSKDISLEEEDRSEEPVSPKATKKKKQKKEVVKKNMGMDIRNCMAGGINKSKTPEKPEIIEIISDASEDGFSGFPAVDIEPPTKICKLDKINEPAIGSSVCGVLVSYFEENNNMCCFLSKYMLPKKGFSIKKKFSFGNPLPALDKILNNVNYDILNNLSYCRVFTKAVIEIPFESPVVNIPFSPQLNTSTFFEIDDLFNDEDTNESKLDTPKKNVSHLNSSLNNDGLNKHSQLDPGKIVVAKKDKDFQSKNNVDNFDDTPSIFNCPIDSDTDINFSDGEGINNIRNNEENSNLKAQPNSQKCMVSDNNKIACLPYKEDKNKTVSAKDSPVIKNVQNILSDSEKLLSVPNNECAVNKVDKLKPDLVFSDDDDFFTEVEKEINITREIPRICSTPSKPHFSSQKPHLTNTEQSPILTTNMVCSTPLVSVKKFKKNIIVFEPKKEEVKPKSPLSDVSDMWSLSDLFEDESDRENTTTAQETTQMLGVTQMVSFIEREKKERENFHVSDDDSKSKKNNSSSDQINSSNNKNISAFLDSDVDIFSEFNDNFQDNLHSKDTNPLEESLMLTQKYNVCSQDENMKNNKIDYIDDDFSPPQKYTNQNTTAALEHQINVSLSLNTEDLDNLENNVINADRNKSDISIFNDNVQYLDSEENPILESMLLSQKYSIPVESSKKTKSTYSNNVDFFSCPIEIKPKQNKPKEIQKNHTGSTFSEMYIPNNDKQSIDNRINSSEFSETIPSQSFQVNYKKFSKKVLFPQKGNPMLTSNTEGTATNEEGVNSKDNSCSIEKKIESPEIKKSSACTRQLERNDSSDDDVFLIPFANKPNELHKKAKVSHAFIHQRSLSPLETTTQQKSVTLPPTSSHPSKQQKNANFTEDSSISCKEKTPSMLQKNEIKTKKIKKRKKIKKSNDLIETEADVSGSISLTDDTDGSSLDDLDASFINDYTECISDHTQAIYLKSVKSPPVGPGKFKMPTEINYDQNVYSQLVPENDSEYINDSFCVDSDDETDDEYEKSLSLLEIAERKLQNKKKTDGGKTKKRRRILNVTSEESPSPAKIQRTLINTSDSKPKASTVKRKRRLIKSDSDSDTNSQNKRHYIDLTQLDQTCTSATKVSKNNMNTGEDLTSIDNKENKSVFLTKSRNLVSTEPSSNYLDGNERPKHTLFNSKIDKKLINVNKKFSESIRNVRQKYFNSDESSDD